MKAIEYTDYQLYTSIQRLEKDWNRLYPDGSSNNPLDEILQYHRYLYNKRKNIKR